MGTKPEDIDRLKVELDRYAGDKSLLAMRLRAEQAERRAELLERYAKLAMSWIEDKHPDEAKQYLPDFVDAYRDEFGN